MKNPWAIALVVLVVLIGGAYLYSASAGEKGNDGVSLENGRVATLENIDTNDETLNLVHAKGNLESAVVLVEFGDFQCPACASFQPAVDDVLAKYGEFLRFEFRHMPLPMHQKAVPAARAAEAAGQQGKFFEFVDLLYKNQNTWANTSNHNALFVKYATDLGLDIDVFKTQLKSSILRDVIKSEQKYADTLNVTGTPTFFLNGEKMAYRSYEEFFEQIEAALDPKIRFDVSGAEETVTDQAE